MPPIGEQFRSGHAGLKGDVIPRSETTRNLLFSLRDL